MSFIIEGCDLPDVLYTDIRIYNDGRVAKIIGRDALLSIPGVRAIQIDSNNTELLEFFNEFKKWKASKEVAKYINATYG